jgi:hypothetical protein
MSHRNAQRSGSSRLAGLRNMDPSYGCWTIRFGSEHLRQFTEPWLHPIGLDIREGLMVHARCSAMAATWLVRGPQHIQTRDLVVEGVEPISR